MHEVLGETARRRGTRRGTMPAMLLLFDVDGTLLLSSGQGAKAMQEAGREVLGPTFSLSNVTFAGRLDPIIFRDGLKASGLHDGFESRHDAFRVAYAESLTRRLAASGVARPLPGVMDLLARLRERDDVTLGLLTGNYPETGATKLRAAGIDPAWFPVAVWGIDGATRRDLPPVAIHRYEVLHEGRRPRRLVVIGDTVHDVDCAHHAGGLVLAVASGPAYTRADLQAHDPDLLLDTLEDTDTILAWLESL